MGGEGGIGREWVERGDNKGRGLREGRQEWKGEGKGKGDGRERKKGREREGTEGGEAGVERSIPANKIYDYIPALKQLYLAQ